MVLIFMHGHLFVLQGGSEVPLQEVLSFFSGASQIPPLGFDAEPSITFSHDAVYPFFSLNLISILLCTQSSIGVTFTKCVCCIDLYDD